MVSANDGSSVAWCWKYEPRGSVQLCSPATQRPLLSPEVPALLSYLWQLQPNRGLKFCWHTSPTMWGYLLRIFRNRQSDLQTRPDAFDGIACCNTGMLLKLTAMTVPACRDSGTPLHQNQNGLIHKTGSKFPQSDGRKGSIVWGVEYRLSPQRLADTFDDIRSIVFLVPISNVYIPHRLIP